MASALRPSEDISAPDFMQVKGKNFSLTRYKLAFLVGEGASAVAAAYGRVGASPAPDEVACKFSRDAAQLAREADIMSQLSHPHIVELYGRVDLPGMGCSVLEFCGGGSLEDLILRCGAMPSSCVTMIGVQVLLVLDYLHSLGVAHGDMKPGNILFDEDFYVKVCDFGLSKDLRLMSVPVAHSGASSASQTPPLVSCGSMMFLSHERLTTILAALCPDRFSPQPAYSRVAADMWALGVSLFDMLTGGEMPFDEDRVGEENDTALQAAEIFWSSENPPILDIYRRLVELSTPEKLKAHLLRSCLEPPASGLVELVLGLLKVNPVERLTAPAALQLPYLSSFFRALLSRQAPPPRRSGIRPPSKQTVAYATLGAELLKGKKNPSADLAFRELRAQLARIMSAGARSRDPSDAESATLLLTYDEQVRRVAAAATNRYVRCRLQKVEQGHISRGARAVSRAVRRVSDARITTAHGPTSHIVMGPQPAKHAAAQKSAIRMLARAAAVVAPEAPPSGRLPQPLSKFLAADANGAKPAVAASFLQVTPEIEAPASVIAAAAVATADDTVASAGSNAEAALHISDSALHVQERGSPSSSAASHGPALDSSCAVDAGGRAAYEVLSSHRPGASGSARLSGGLSISPAFFSAKPAVLLRDTAPACLPVLQVPPKTLPFSTLVASPVKLQAVPITPVGAFGASHSAGRSSSHKLTPGSTVANVLNAVAEDVVQKAYAASVAPANVAAFFMKNQSLFVTDAVFETLEPRLKKRSAVILAICSILSEPHPAGHMPVSQLPRTRSAVNSLSFRCAADATSGVLDLTGSPGKAADAASALAHLRAGAVDLVESLCVAANAASVDVSLSIPVRSEALSSGGEIAPPKVLHAQREEVSAVVDDVIRAASAANLRPESYEKFFVDHSGEFMHTWMDELTRPKQVIQRALKLRVQKLKEAEESSAAKSLDRGDRRVKTKA